MSTKTDPADIEHARDRLSYLKPNDDVYTVIEHVSSSGMTRWVRVLLPRKSDDGKLWIDDVSWEVAKLIDHPVNTRNHAGIEVGGCGMNMAFAVVYELGRALWPNGFDCVDPNPGGYSSVCPANDHVNHRRGEEPTPFHHNDGGYALNKRSL